MSTVNSPSSQQPACSAGFPAATADQGRSVAQVSGLGTSSVCTAPGDSGGAYTAGGYALGMTSGGPSNQRCGFNGGYMRGSSYFQPVQDALNYYRLRYGHR